MKYHHLKKISSKFQNCLNMCVHKSPSKHCNMTMWISFLITMTKYLTETSEEDFIWTPGLRRCQSIMLVKHGSSSSRKMWLRLLIPSQVRKQAEPVDHTQVSPTLAYVHDLGPMSHRVQGFLKQSYQLGTKHSRGISHAGHNNDVFWHALIFNFLGPYSKDTF